MNVGVLDSRLTRKILTVCEWIAVPVRFSFPTGD